jgi:hypothetical protein
VIVPSTFNVTVLRRDRMDIFAQLGYLGLSVRDPDQWEQFGAQVLGLQPNGRDQRPMWPTD